ncbi:hypothetical protein FACS189475_02110 [Betaproteobacteria bacterium]|nr:hypothetical protein FACS189475_02110 [Betaproteobacteria bacterium]
MILSFQKGYGQFITSGAQIGLLSIGMEMESPEGWLACLALMAFISLFAWMSTMRRRRAITDTPTSRIASAAQGYVELFGVGLPIDDPPLFSRKTRQPCLWYRYQKEEKTDKDWAMVESQESEVSFIIDDGSGRCVIDVEGAEILSRHKETWIQADYRHTEWTLDINDKIYALGEFRTLGGGSVDLDARQDLSELLSEWKKDGKRLFERFDLDGDGQLNETEWGLARQAARREVSKMHIEARNASDVNTLSAPGNGRHYLLSNINPNQLARRYLWWSLFHLTIFLGALGTIPWVLQQHF